MPADEPGGMTGRTRRPRAGSALTRPERRRAGALAAAILALHLVGFGILLALVVPHELALGDGAAFGVGLGLAAYTLGMRHGLDADHIGAIDNVTRALTARGRRPLATGFFFALGHSTVVLALAVLLLVGVRGLGGAVADPGSALHSATGVAGPLVSGVVLLAIGLLNLGVLAGAVRTVRGVRRGELDERALREGAVPRGPLLRILGRATHGVRASWQMYPLGLLFGLGFDTATEIALLATAGAAAADGLPVYAVLCLPILFAAGMTLVDTLDGALMTMAYGWSGDAPVRRVFYSLAVTALSVAVALAVGAIELLGVVGDRVGGPGGALRAAGRVDLELVGWVVVGLFVMTWAVAVAVWRLGRIEERWSVAARPPPDGS